MKQAPSGPQAGPASGNVRLGAWPRMSAFALEHLLLLPLGAFVALVWANVAPEQYFQATHPYAFLVNDVAMVFFFGVIMKEIVEATAPNGVLHTWRRILVPVIGSVGGALGATAMFALLVELFDEPMLIVGWPVVLAIDLGFAYFAGRMIFRRHPAMAFLLLVAIASDGLAFGSLALFHPARELNVVWAVSLMTFALLLAGSLRAMRVTSFWPYLLVSGSISWLALFLGGFHPALALVPVVPFLPHAARDRGFFVDSTQDERDTLSRFEQWCRYPAQAALFFFGLVNAGVRMSALEAGTLTVPLAVFVGRPIGMLVASALAIAAGLHLPARVTWRDIAVVSLLSTIGFTLALFCATSTVPAGQLLSELKVGSLLTVIAAPAAFGLARLLRVGRFASQQP